ncbi:unnamed protein product [Closterium sp. NIES-54]
MVTTTTPGGQRVSICTCTRTSSHLATFTRRPGSSLATKPPQLAASTQRFRADHPVLRLHSDRGGESSSDLLRDFCRGEGILQSFTLPDSPRQNGIAERRIGLVMEVAHTSMIHAAPSHFLWPFATGKVGNATVFRVWGSRAFVRDTSTDKLSARAIPASSLALSLTRLAGSFTTPPRAVSSPLRTSRLTSRFPFTISSPPLCSSPTPAALPCSRPPSNRPPPPPQGPAPSGVSQVETLPGTAPVEVAVGSGAARGAASGGAEPGVAESEGAGSGGAASGG